MLVELSVVEKDAVVVAEGGGGLGGGEALEQLDGSRGTEATLGRRGGEFCGLLVLSLLDELLELLLEQGSEARVVTTLGEGDGQGLITKYVEDVRDHVVCVDAERQHLLER